MRWATIFPNQEVSDLLMIQFELEWRWHDSRCCFDIADRIEGVLRELETYLFGRDSEKEEPSSREPDECKAEQAEQHIKSILSP